MCRTTAIVFGGCLGWETHGNHFSQLLIQEDRDLIIGICVKVTTTLSDVILLLKLECLYSERSQLMWVIKRCQIHQWWTSDPLMTKHNQWYPKDSILTAWHLPIKFKPTLPWVLSINFVCTSLEKTWGTFFQCSLVHSCDSWTYILSEININPKLESSIAIWYSSFFLGESWHFLQMDRRWAVICTLRALLMCHSIHVCTMYFSST